VSAEILRQVGNKPVRFVERSHSSIFSFIVCPLDAAPLARRFRLLQAIAAEAVPDFLAGIAARP
jgi:hypothetical protein